MEATESIMPLDPTNPATWNLIATDDEPDTIEIMEILCTHHNIQLRTASSGPQCLELLTDQIPDLLLLDIQMPDMSGWEVLKLVREDPNPTLNQMPVVAMTAHAVAGDR